MDDLLTLHRKQLRDLQSVITQKKKQATKKTRRGVNDECEHLERALKEKHAAEIAALQNELDPTADTAAASEALDGEENTASKGAGPDEPTEDKLSLKMQETQIDDGDSSATPSNHNPSPQSATASTTGGKKPNRQKARLARRAAQIEEATAEAEREAAAQPNLRVIEAERMNQLFKEHELTEVPIAPDGHCLYSAFAVGLEAAGISLSTSTTSGRDDNDDGDGEGDASEQRKQKQRGYTFTRQAAGEYISAHPDEFAPFLEEGTTLDEHVRKVTGTAEWGGQMELSALAKQYGVTVRVVQAQGVGVMAMNEEGEAKADVWLAYHRRGYGLGEHYNALRKNAT